MIEVFLISLFQFPPVFTDHRLLLPFPFYFDLFVLGDCEVEVRFYRGKGYGVQGGIWFPVNWIVRFAREQC